MLVQPQSLVAARDAQPVRDAVCTLTGMWTCNERVFDASVRVCAPVVVRGAIPPRYVRRWSGRAADPASPATIVSNWSPSLVRDDEPPAVDLAGTGRLGDIASATAGFRRQFYGLAPYVIDAPDADEKRLVGKVWESRSGGKCLFAMPTQTEFSEITKLVNPQ